MRRSTPASIIMTACTWCLLGASACGDASGVVPVAAIAVRNLTADTIAVMLLERETSYLVDPVPERAASEETDRLIVPGGERVFDVARVPGYVPGKDIRLFLYRIRAGRSVFAGIRDAPNISLRASGYVVSIPVTAFQ